MIYHLVGKKVFSSERITPTRTRIYENYVEPVYKVCDICRARTKQNKDFKTFNIKLTRKAPIENGQYYYNLIM